MRRAWLKEGLLGLSVAWLAGVGLWGLRVGVAVAFATFSDLLLLPGGLGVALSCLVRQ